MITDIDALTRWERFRFNFWWWILQNIPCGNLAPYIFGFAISRRPHKIN